MALTPLCALDELYANHLQCRLEFHWGRIYLKQRLFCAAICTHSVILNNSLWPDDTIWRHKSGSTLAQVMACCLTRFLETLSAISTKKLNEKYWNYSCPPNTWKNTYLAPLGDRTFVGNMMTSIWYRALHMIRIHYFATYQIIYIVVYPYPQNLIEA